MTFKILLRPEPCNTLFYGFTCKPLQHSNFFFKQWHDTIGLHDFYLRQLQLMCNVSLLSILFYNTSRTLQITFKPRITVMLKDDM